jgi:hypothetical protein
MLGLLNLKSERIKVARARNIKPAFFVNDDLSDCKPLARLLFIGLWTIADWEGRLKDRPRQIKAQILPYDKCDAESLLINLEQSGFIQRYTVQGQPVIQVTNFSKHQNPHKNEREKASVFGTYDQRDVQHEEKQTVSSESSKIEINLDKDGTTRADSLLPLTDSLLPKNQDRHVMKEKRSKQKLTKANESKQLTVLANTNTNTTDQKRCKKRFAPPLIEEVKQYCNERKNTVNPETFINFYEAKGWEIGKNKMKSWKACIRTWENRENESSKQTENNGFDNRSRAKKVSDKLDELAADAIRRGETI